MNVETPFLSISLVLYMVTLVLVVRNADDKTVWLALIPAVLTHLVALAFRSMIAHHPPFTSIYETFMLLPFLVSMRLVFWREQIQKNHRWLVLSSIAFLILISLLMPANLKTPKPLMPALNSVWMYIHVPSYFFGYMALIIGTIYAVILLIKSRNGKNAEESDLLRRMDNEIKIAFLFLNVGLITGGIWAYISWGNYWSWDPKETWALINILVLASYFHLQKQTIRKKAIIIILTFITVLFTYLGVTFILQGLHSYA